VTIAALLLAFMSLGTASAVMLVSRYGILAVIALLALLRLRAGSPIERGRAAAFLIIAATLACLYALPFFGRSFSFAPSDFVIFAFILYGMLQPLGQISRHRFMLATAAFGTLTAIFEFLTGGIPMGLATLIALIALGGAPDQRTMVDRMIIGTTTFAAAIVACFAYKLLAVAAIFGTNELAEFARLLTHRVTGSVQSLLSDNAKEALKAYHIDPLWIDENIFTRVLFAGVMLTYSSFYLGWGSHLLGAAIVLLTTPLLVAMGLSSFRQPLRGSARTRGVGGSRHGSRAVVHCICKSHDHALVVYGAAVGFECCPMHHMHCLRPAPPALERALMDGWKSISQSVTSCPVPRAAVE